MSRVGEKRIATAGRWLLVSSFLIGIWLPFLDVAFELDPAPEIRELRPPAPWPELRWQAEVWHGLPAALETYWDDHFGFRRSLIRLGNRLRLLTRDNPLDTEVIVGRAGWLYVNAGGGLLDDRRAVRPWAESDLEARGRRLIRHSDWLADRGIAYLYVLAPDKHTIHPEYLPARIRRARDRDRTDQWVDYLRAAGLAVVDLRDVLRRVRSEGELYPANGSHWNDLGAYHAYAEIQARLARRFKAAAPAPRSAFELTVQRRRGDLAQMLGLVDLLRADYRMMSRRGPARARRTEDGVARLPGRHPTHRLPFAYQIDDPVLPRAVMFRDSFATALVPFMSEHYRRIAYYWTSFSPRVVRHEIPELVIEEQVERLATRSVARGGE